MQQHQRCAVAAGLAAPSQMEREPSEAIDSAGGLGRRRSSRSARAQRPARANGRQNMRLSISLSVYFWLYWEKRERVLCSLGPWGPYARRESLALARVC